MAIGLEHGSEITKSLRIGDFADAFGADGREISAFCGELVETMDFRYRVCSPEARENIFLDVIKKCDSGAFSVSGSHRFNDWRRGWSEVLRDFYGSGKDLNILVPKYLHGDRPMRYKHNYITSTSNSFERDFSLVFRHWLFKKYFKDCKNVYEFGCGTGQDIALLATVFPEKKLFGLDWVPESQKLVEAIADEFGWQMKGFQFDLFNPDYDLKILPDSLVYTFSAMEQLGGDFGSFLSYLVSSKPNLCVNVECMSELYDENSLYDYVALRYHKARNYLDGFLTKLRELEKEGVIRIMTVRRTGFGSLYHEGYMFVIWKIL
jgi:SAM-dependent methyltransferase